MSKIVLRSLSILLGAFFIFLGALKLTPRLSKDLHKDLRTEYAKYSKAFPLAKQLDLKLPSKWYRRTVGATEVGCGVALAALPHRMAKNAANVVLIGVKSLNAYSHWAINDEFARTAPTLVFLLMLGCRLVVDWQQARRERQEAEEAAAAAGKQAKVTAGAEETSAAVKKSQ